MKRFLALVAVWLGLLAVAPQPARAQTVPDEIVELARALKNDPDLIFEYVYNNIRTLPMQGSIKGALGALIDSEGTAWDQAELMVLLLRQSGYTANFAIGSVHLAGSEAANWLGTDTSVGSITRALYLGGFTYGYTSSGGNVTDIHFDWAWIEVALPGVCTCVFDPATKYGYTGASGYNRATGMSVSALASAMGYDRSSFVSDAAAVTTTSPWSLTSLNRTALRNDLASYSSNLVQYLRSNNPAATTADIIGGIKGVVPLPLNTQYRSGEIPRQFLSHYDTSADIPSAYRVTLTQQLGSIDGSGVFQSLSSAITFNTADIYGHRMTLAFSASAVPSLLIDGVAQVTASGAVPSGRRLVVKASLSYPWGQPNNYPGMVNDTSTQVPPAADQIYAVLLSLGSTSRAMIERHRRVLAQNMAANPSAPTSEPVLGESLMIVAYTYAAEAAQYMRLASQLSATVLMNFNYYGTFGVTTFGGVTGPQISIWHQAHGYVQASNRTTSAVAVTQIESNALVADGLLNGITESATLQQTQPGNIGFSVVKALDLAVQQGMTVYDFNNHTQSGNNQTYFNNNANSLLTNWSQGDRSALNKNISDDERVITPKSGSLSVQQYVGAGWTRDIQNSGFDALGGFISGQLNGGGATQTTENFDVAGNTFYSVTPATYDDYYSTPIESAGNRGASLGFTASSFDPVNLVTGDAFLNTTDLSVGSSAMPIGLSFQRYYDSGTRLVAKTLGNGWTHNFDITAKINSDPFQGLATLSPINGASAIVGTLVVLDIAASDNVLVGRSLANIVIANLVYAWTSDQLADNVVIVTQPGYVEQFVKLADGSYNPPPGSGAALSFDGTSYTYLAKDRTTLAFNAAGNLATWTSPAGPSMTLSYDTSTPPLLTQVLNNSGPNNIGRSLTFSYTGGLLTQVDDGTGRSISFGYDASNNLTSFVDVLGQTTTYVYDLPGRMTQIFYPWTGTTPFVTNIYDSLGRVKTQTNVLGGTWNYFLAGARSEEVDPDGVRHVLYNTPTGKTAVEIQAFNPALAVSQWIMTSSTYDGLDRLVSQTAPEGNSTSYTYDLKSNLLTLTRTPKPGSSLSPLVVTTTWDATFNKPLTITDPRGLVTTNTYDATSGNLLTTVADAGAGHFNSTTRFSYNAFGLPLTITDPAGVVTQNSYDSFNNLLSVVRDYGSGRLNQTTSYTWNARGDPLTVANANGNVTTSTYDAARRVTTVTTPPAAGVPGGLQTAYTYDSAGRVTQTQQKSLGTVLRSTSATYTLSGKTATATDANSHTTTFAYDLLDRLVKTVDAENRVTTYAYDALGRRIAVSNPAISPSTPLAQQTFTLNGQRASLTDAMSNVTAFAYDGLDRLSVTTYPAVSGVARTETLSYDADSNVTLRCTRAGKPIAYTWDTLNRLSTKTLPGTASTCAGTPNGVVTSYAYDLAGRMTNVSDTSPSITSISTAGAPISFTTSTSYDALNRPTGVSYNPAPAATTSPAAFTTVSFGHTFNKVNQRTGQSVSDSNWIDYPTAANALCYTANALNQYSQLQTLSGGTCSGATITPTYDDNANLTSEGSGTFGYDAENRLVSADVGGTVTNYQFDGRGRRKKKADISSGTIFVTGADNRELLEYDAASGTILRWYAYGLGPNDLLGQINVGPNTRAAFIPDMLGSVIGTQDAASGTITKFGYGTYGSSAAAPSNFAYTGQRIDPESGLYYYRARHYSPFLGRFNQTDPIGNLAAMHLYAYVENDPLNLTDSSGNCPWCFGAISSVVLGGIIRGVTGGDIFDVRAIAMDAALGAVGVGVFNKVNQVARLAQFSEAIPLSTMLGATGKMESITQGAYYLSQSGVSYIGQGGLRASGATVAERIAESATLRFGSGTTVADDAIRFAVSNGANRASREVAEQRLISAVGGIDNGSLLNRINPIGSARSELLTAPGYGNITGVAVPNLVEGGGAAMVGGTIGASRNISTDK